MQLGAFGGHFACSRAEADPEIIVSGRGGERERKPKSLNDIQVVLYAQVICMPRPLGTGDIAGLKSAGIGPMACPRSAVDLPGF